MTKIGEKTLPVQRMTSTTNIAEIDSLDETYAEDFMSLPSAQLNHFVPIAMIATEGTIPALKFMGDREARVEG